MTRDIVTNGSLKVFCWVSILSQAIPSGIVSMLLLESFRESSDVVVVVGLNMFLCMTLGLKFSAIRYL